MTGWEYMLLVAGHVGVALGLFVGLVSFGNVLSKIAWWLWDEATEQ